MVGRRRDGFTIVELLVVIGVIGILAALLIPTISSVRAAARDANTRNTIQNLSSAINAYHADFRGYPGPLSNVQIEFGGGDPAYQSVWIRSADFSTYGFANPEGSDMDTSISVGKISMTENMVCGLLGGFKILPNGTSSYRIYYDPRLVGQGAQSLNPLRPSKAIPYFAEGTLSWRTGRSGSTIPVATDQANRKTGRFADMVGAAGDTVIPEFVDKGISPMPIIYVRPRLIPDFVGATESIADNPIVVSDNQYGKAAISIFQLRPYANTDTNPISGRDIGEDVQGWRPPASSTNRKHGLNLPTTIPNPVNLSGSTIDAYSYFKNPGASRSEIRAKDSFILIAPGRDRRYGTLDDITSFGRVGG